SNHLLLDLLGYTLLLQGLYLYRRKLTILFCRSNIRYCLLIHISESLPSILYYISSHFFSGFPICEVLLNVVFNRQEQDFYFIEHFLGTFTVCSLTLNSSRISSPIRLAFCSSSLSVVVSEFLSRQSNILLAS